MRVEGTYVVAKGPEDIRMLGGSVEGDVSRWNARDKWEAEGNAHEGYYIHFSGEIGRPVHLCSPEILDAAGLVYHGESEHFI